MTDVRCYAGSRSPERPFAFEREGTWLEIVQIRRQAYTPEGLIFDVLARDGRRYRLTWNQAADTWTVVAAAEL